MLFLKNMNIFIQINGILVHFDVGVGDLNVLGYALCSMDSIINV